MKNICLLLFFLISVQAQAQLSYQKKSHIKTGLQAKLHFGQMPSGFSPSLLREAPQPSTGKQKPELSTPPAPALKAAEIQKTQVYPGVLKSFAGQGYQFSVPNDNHLAVGADGKLISVVNTNITAYDTAGNVLFSNALGTFADTLGVLGYTFDPRVIYDPVADRYIVTFLNGYLDSTSQIIIAFSQSADPAGFWNCYMLNGNPLNNSTWSDYPAIGISQQELFITFNTFTNGSTNNSGYTESTIWQIDKNKGYAGDSLLSDYYYNITWAGDTLFNTTPVNGGILPYGDNMYFLNTNPFSSGTDSVYILEITQTLASGSASLQLSSVSMGTPYYQPVPAKQKNNHTLDTNDARVQSAILENDVLHFTLNTAEPISQQAAVYYGRVKQFSSSKISQAIILTDTVDLAYGAVAFAGDNTKPESVILACLHSSASTFAGHSAFYIDDNLALSPRCIVKTGNSLLNVISGTSERWGDYTGISIEPGTPGVVWFGGSYSSSNSRNMTWISRIGVSQFPLQISENESAHVSEINLYPNPAQNIIQVDFTVLQGEVLEFNIYNIQGKKVKTILKEWMRAGLQILSFDSDPLSSGLYLFKIENPDGDIIASRTFTVIK